MRPALNIVIGIRRYQSPEAEKSVLFFLAKGLGCGLTDVTRRLRSPRIGPSFDQGSKRVMAI
jgi:hypothetical protein